MPRIEMQRGVVLLLSLFIDSRAVAGDEACEERFDMVASAVTRTLDREEAPWATPLRLDPACGCLVPRLRFNDCEGRPTTFSVRRFVWGSQIYAEFTFPRLPPPGDPTSYEPTAVEYVLQTGRVLEPLQDHADPNTVVAVGVARIATWCPPSDPSSDGTVSVFSASATDVPADVGEAVGSNPNIVDFGPDDALSIVHLECESG